MLPLEHSIKLEQVAGLEYISLRRRGCMGHNQNATDSPSRKRSAMRLLQFGPSIQG